MERKELKSSKGMQLLSWAVFLFYFLCIVYINFSGRPSFYCTDMYSDMIYAQKVREGRTLFPENWVFGNQLYVVATPVLAALVMGIFENPQVAMSFAATVYALLVVAGFAWMIKPVMKSGSVILSIVLFMAIPLYFGDPVYTVNGWQLLFTMCSYYACYALTAFLAFGCYVRSEQAHNWTYYLALALTCLLSFGTGMQSLRQTAIMTLPLLGVECLKVLFHLKRRERCLTNSSWIALLICASNVFGVVAKQSLDVQQMEIFGQIEFDFSLAAIGKVFTEISTLFLRQEGDTLLLFVVLLVFFCISLVIWGRNILREWDKMSAVMLGVVVFSVLAIAAADAFTTMQVRGIYYFMLYPLMAMCVSKGMERGKKGIRIGTVLLAGLLVLPSMRILTDYCMQGYFKKYDNHFEVSDYLQEQGFTTVYSQWNFGEKIAISSDFEIDAGFWDVVPYVSVPYLCDPEIYNADPAHSAYLFGNNFESGIEAAEKRGVHLKEEAYFPESGIHVFTADRCLMDPVAK